ncbi:MAG: hypothetical protein KTR21_07825 [Rhodobacteraceae bacterium]|nr:hypothetical protein [Paracoccaceae bacterium]
MAQRLAAGIIFASALAALNIQPAAGQSGEGCFWGMMAPDRVYLCPEPTADGQRGWRVVRSERLGPPRQEPQRHEPQMREPRYAAHRNRQPPRANLPTPRVYPRVGVGIGSGGDVNVGAGVGIGLGIFSLGVDLID